ncbi:hypothetical protein [Streptomyces sp. NPDC127105]|uniref:hypothetical protein n=1 Tax=Streptomyces sp. NPDC127105 TaxID=3345359 RepID=UPI003661AFEF
MAFGRSRKVEESPVQPVGWVDAWEFVIGTEQRPAAGGRKDAAHGPRAFRVPIGGGMHRVSAPCAFFPPGAQSSTSTPGDLRLFEDPEGQQLLCSVTAPEDRNGERYFQVHDADGRVIGSIRTAAALRRALKPEWYIEHPGRPAIVSCHEWAKGGAKGIVQRGTGKFLTSVVQGVADLDAEGGDHSSPQRPLEWRADDELVMSSQGHCSFLLRAGWIDRRLVFAYALVRNG